jgi:hypothetical protein
MFEHSKINLLRFETAKEENIRKDKELKECRKIVEEAGVCQSCDRNCREAGNLRWVSDGEFYVCYECFLHNLSCAADVAVPMRRACDMKEYISDSEWDDSEE